MKAPIHPIIITVLIFSCTGNVNATTLFNDTTRTTKPWKISEHQFLDQYGKDDTSRAIINYYFKQYNGGHKHLFVNTAIASAGIALFAIIMANEADAGAIIAGVPFILGGVIFGMLAFRNAINMIYFSRKKLFKVLKKYFESKKISDSLRKDIYRKKR